LLEGIRKLTVGVGLQGLFVSDVWKLNGWAYREEVICDDVRELGLISQNCSGPSDRCKK